jgi:hypothetical protein
VPRRAGRGLRSRDLAFFFRGVYQGRRSAGGVFAEGSAAEVGALEGRGQVGPIGSSFSRLVSRHDVNE